MHIFNIYLYIHDELRTQYRVELTRFYTEMHKCPPRFQINKKNLQKMSSNKLLFI